MKKRFETQTSIEHGNYRELLSCAEKLSAGFLLVVRHETLDSTGQAILAALQPYLAETTEE